MNMMNINFDAVEFYGVVNKMQDLFGVNYYAGEVKLVTNDADKYVFENEHGFKYVMYKKLKISYAE